MRQSLLAVCAVFVGAAAGVWAESGYYRQPAIHGDIIVFTSEGDLWKVGAGGGAAQRLTTHAAEEAEARLSPDGRFVAFTASYDSAVEAYVMPLAGGAPQRVTFDGGRVWLQGWTPQNEVLYASAAVAGPARQRVLRAVDPQTLQERRLPLQDVHEAAVAEDGRTLYCVRFGLQLTGDNVRRYRGGATAQLWKFALDGQGEAQRLAAEEPGSLSRPMPWGGRVYYVSDSDGVQNLWSMLPDGSDRRQHTRHREFEVRGASQGGGRIVYQLGADLRLYDIAAERDTALSIELVSDFEQRRQRFLRSAGNFHTHTALAADGAFAALTARGKVVLAAPGPLRRRELAVPGDRRARAAVPSADGRSVYLIVDVDGTHEVWRLAADGSPAVTVLVPGAKVHRWGLYPSPDGRWLAHTDKLGRLWLLELARGGSSQLVDSFPRTGNEHSGVTWSADGRYLAFVRPDSGRLVDQVHVYAPAERRLQTLTSDRYDSYAPAFSRDGRFLYFLSDRTLVPTPGAPWGDRNMGPQFDRRTKVYAYALQAQARFPFLPPDELHPEAPKDAAGAKPSEGAPAKAATPVAAIEWQGLTDRLYEVPLAAGNYSHLALGAERLYVLERPSGPDAKPLLRSLALQSLPAPPETFASDVGAFQLSADGKKLLFEKWKEQGLGELYIVEAGAKPPEDLAKHQVRLGDWVLALTPQDEWRQMFADAWRMHRDFSFDPLMRGLDWEAVRARYEPLVARVNERGELDDVLAQMSAELGILHSQVRGGELRKDAEGAAAAGLGAELARVAGGAQVRRIYRTEPELPGERGPLQQPGVDVREGDLIVALNGRPLAGVADIAELLHNQAGQQVLLELRRGSAVSKQVVVPVSAEREALLRYGDWVQRTREVVERAGRGRIGYLHLRAMGSSDVAAFAREFYAHHDREGLIVDVRRNNGGNIDSWVIEKLLRRVWAFWQPPGMRPYTNMQQAFRGHLAVLIDPYTYSDGETFAAGIKSLGLGRLFGQRTAGAGIWLSDRNRLSDNGLARIAENGQFRLDGRWLIEGRGVAPDVEVENPPFESYQGRDRQLEAALDYLAGRLREAPLAPLQAEPIPPPGTPGSDAKQP